MGLDAALDQGVLFFRSARARRVNADRSFCCALGSPNAFRIDKASSIFPIIPLLKMVDDFSINSELGANDFIQVSWQVFCLGHNFTNLLYDREVGQGKVP